MMYMTREDRLIPLNSLHNTRDLGGYETQDGHFTKSHKIIRSATNSTLTNEDIDILKTYGIHTILDLRGEQEVTLVPHPLKDHDEFSYCHIDLFAHHPISKEDYHHLGDLYCLVLERCQDNIKHIFDFIIAHVDEGIMITCAQGKDRTGIISALILDLVGCHPYDIVKDYSESFENNEEIYRQMMAYMNDDALEQLMSDPLYMMKMMNYLDEHYGSGRSYLLSLGFDHQTLDDFIEDFLI